MTKKTSLYTTDPHIADLIISEEKRQYDTINLIASENYTHPAIREATASVLTHKYAEGIQANGTTLAANILMKLKKLPVNDAPNFLTPNMPTYNHMRAHKQILPFIMHSLNLVIPFLP